MVMRRFHLRAPQNIKPTYHQPGSIVAECVEFSDGRIAMRWGGSPSSSTWYDDMAELQGVYSACSIDWLDNKCPGCGDPVVDGDGNCENGCRANEEILKRMRKTREWPLRVGDHPHA